MLTMEAVGNGGWGKVERFGGGGQGEINWWHQDDHRWDIVLVCLYCFPPFPSPPWVVDSAENWICGYKYWGSSDQNYHQPWLRVRKVNFSEASWNNINFGGWIINSPGWKCEWEISMHHWDSGKWCQPYTRSVRQKWITRTYGTVGQRWLRMTLCCSKLSWLLSYSILRWYYRPCRNTLLPSSYVSACS